MGCFMSAGGIGAATPPHFGPSNYHYGSKRDSRDNVINSPEKKSCNVGEYMARLSESIAARSTSRDRECTREQVEVDEAMQIIQEDGVPGTSDIFFEAIKLFKNSVTHRVFRNLLDTEDRMAWLTRNLKRNNK